MDSLYVIDASGYLYRSYFAIRNITNSKGESTNALYGFIRSVLKLFKDFQPQHLVAVFDGPRNAHKRVAIYPEYKAHRSAMPPDLLYQIHWAQEFCAHIGIPLLNIPEVEADDTMGAVAKWAVKENLSVFLCTSDKDMCQLVNDKIKILNTHKDNLVLGPKEVETQFGVPPEKMLDFLAIVGDSSDNIPGIAGFGPKTAASLLNQFGSLDYLLAHPEEIPGKGKQEAIVTYKEKALISRQLAAIDLSVNIPLSLDFYTLKPADSPRLKAFYSNMSFNSLIKEMEKETGPAEIRPTSEISTSYTLVDDEASFTELLNHLSKQSEIGFTTKGTKNQPIKAEFVGIGFGLESEPGKAWYIPANGGLGLERVVKGIKPLFENKNIRFFGHNVKCDLQVLGNLGIHVATLSFDTILASYLLNSHIRQHSLDSLLLHIFGKVKTDISTMVSKGKNLISLAEVPADKVCAYCGEEIDYICRLKTLLEKELKERQLDQLLYELELPLVKVLARMERKGIYLDKPCLEKMAKEVAEQIKGLEQEIFQMAGEEFNLNSPKQISEILFTKLGIKAPKKTATGLSTNADVLEFLKPNYPIAGKLYEYRILEKLRSTYIDALPQEVFPKTQRIHTTYNQSGTATGRLSSQDPNLQNIPIRTEIGRKIREAFRPEKQGWSFLAADYSQIELRLLAHLSQDPTLIKAFQNNEDIHAFTASLIFNVPLAEVNQTQRYQAKAVNFGVIYGQQAFGLAQELGIDVKEAALFIDKYFKRYSHVKDFLESCKEKARQTGKAVTFTGRERLIPEITSKNGQLRAMAERLAVNTPFQGSAADLIKKAMLEIDRLLEKEKKLGYMILQIHDELIFEIPDFEILFFEPLVRKAMEGVMQLKVPLIVDLSLGKNWKEC